MECGSLLPLFFAEACFGGRGACAARGKQACRNTKRQQAAALQRRYTRNDMPLILVNPGNERAEAPPSPAPRLDSLAGKTIALLDISKPGGRFFLDRIELLLRQKHGVKNVIRAMKPTYAKPAPPEIIDSIRGAEAVIEALAD
jgi:hypothetical protein